MQSYSKLMQKNSIKINTLEEIVKKLGYTFENKNLMVESFLHNSILHELKQKKQIDVNTQNYEKFEIIGDSILMMCVRNILFKYNFLKEQHISVLSSILTCNKTLTKICVKLKLDKQILLHHSIKAGAKMKADVIESLIGAISEDSSKNMVVVEQFVKNMFLLALNVDLDNLTEEKINKAILMPYQDLNIEFFSEEFNNNKIKKEVKQEKEKIVEKENDYKVDDVILSYSYINKIMQNLSIPLEIKNYQEKICFILKTKKRKIVLKIEK